MPSIQSILTHSTLNRLETLLLLQYTLNVDRAWLITHSDYLLTAEQMLSLEQLMLRREQGEPIAYIVEEKEFYSLSLKVTPHVLIPRPETELVVDLALERLPASRPVQILELGTGSGAIAIAIAKHRPLATIIATDRSFAALTVAQNNAAHFQLSNIQFMQSDWFSALVGTPFDMIVTNPPYIAANDPHLQQGDLRFEPSHALTDGEDGLSCIRYIISQAPFYLARNGCLILEHGYDQASACSKLFSAAGFINPSSYRDLAGMDRVTLGCLEGK